ncbi:hypothetical protein HDV02_005439 [Globomyces sp. JEL0801]|nr:hypothetical protein HDV02_005439 [Globomyces sp. JEL0801]
MSRRKQPWKGTPENQVILINACLKHFPWNKMHGEIGKAWENVVHDVNIVSDPHITVLCAKIQIDKLLGEYEQFQQKSSNNQPFTASIERPIYGHLKPLYDHYKLQKDSKGSKRLINEQEKVNSTQLICVDEEIMRQSLKRVYDWNPLSDSSSDSDLDTFFRVSSSKKRKGLDMIESMEYPIKNSGTYAQQYLAIQRSNLERQERMDQWQKEMSEKEMLIKQKDAQCRQLEVQNLELITKLLLEFQKKLENNNQWEKERAEKELKVREMESRSRLMQSQNTQRAIDVLLEILRSRHSNK